MKRYPLTALAIASATLIAACGGGSSTTPVAAPAPTPAPAPTVLNGVIASGAAIAGATVTVVDSSATTADVAATALADGSYSADVSNLVAPLLVSASGTLNGESVNIVAVVPSLTSNSSNVANVTPLTNAVAALIAPSGDLSTLSTPATLSTSATTAKVSDASSLIVNTLRTDPVMSAALGSNFDPLSTSFTANGTGIDSVLDRLEVATTSNGVSITNLSAPIANGASVPAPVVLTAAQTATPTVVQTIPTSTTEAMPTPAEMLALAKKYETCLALPVAQRVTMDSTGTVTAVSAPCNYAPGTWKSNGRNWTNDLGQFTFSRDYMTGTTVGQPIIAAVFPAANLTASNEFKHPVCNTATCVVMNIPLTSASGKPISSNWVLGKVNGAWDYVGNGRPYRVFVENRTRRKVGMNTAGQAANPTNFFLKDRIESVMRLGFDVGVGATNNIRAVRFTGPGLTTAGVVVVRSQRCSTEYSMAVTNQEGLLTVNNSTNQQYWNSGSNGDVILSAANLDGTSLARPVASSNWATTASPSNQDQLPEVSSAIPMWSLYKAEIFYFTNTGNTVPDEIVYVRTDTPYEPAGTTASISWPQIADSFATAYLTPTGASAGSISSLAQTMSWTNPVGGYVGSAYLFAQNTVSATNSETETANYSRRSSLDFWVNAFGDSSASGKEFARTASATSLSTYTSSSGTNPNPRCTNTDLTPLETTNSAYREAGLSFRAPNRKLYQSVRFWSN